MAYGKWRDVSAKTAGRFIVSGGEFPAEKIVAHQGLPTLDQALGTVHPDDSRLETVITQGTVLSVVKDSGTSSDTGKERFVPANGYPHVNTAAEDPLTYDSAGDDEVTVPAQSTPVGVAQYHFYRPMFERYDNHGGGFVCGTALVEWPIVTGGGLDGAAPGDLVTFDQSGRPLLVSNAGNDLGDGGNADVDSNLVIGKVLATEDLTATGPSWDGGFDDGLMRYFLFSPREPVVKHVYTITKDGAQQGSFARANLDVADVTGAARVILNL